MPAIDVDVVRSLTAAPELRSDQPAEGTLGVLSGHFTVWDNWYRVSSIFEGDFIERTVAGSAVETLIANRDNMRCQFDHGFDTQIGSKSLGGFRELREDATGGYYEVDLDDTSYNRDLLPGLKRGAYGASFRMRVLEDSWDDNPARSEYNPEGKPERTILRFDAMELGPVAWGANPKATAQVRSDTDLFYEKLRQRDRGAFEAACRAANITIPDFVDQFGEHDSEHGSGPAARSQPQFSFRRRAIHRKLQMRGVVK